MKTARPFATISYNTKTHLIGCLTKLSNTGKLRFWMIIKHFAEEDEEKDHWHVYMEPDGQVDTNVLANEFIEIVPEDLAKGLPPRRCKSFVNSKFDHAYLYWLHDRDYLESLGQSRKHHYKTDALIVSDKADLHEHVMQIDYTRFTSLGSAVRAARSGITLDEYLMSHPIKMVHFRSIQDIWKTYFGKDIRQLERNNHKTHTPKRVFRSPKIYGFTVPINFKGCNRLQ